MRARAIWREVCRDITSGTTRLPLFVFVFVLTVGTLTVADLFQIRSLMNQAEEYRSSGASTMTLTAPGQIDGTSCEALGQLDEVSAAGAVRESGEELTLTLLPTAPLPAWETTPGFPRLLGAKESSGTGIITSDEVAALLGRNVGDSIHTRNGDTRIAGVYPYPDDGRKSGLSYAALIPTTSAEPFDECWIEAWPQSDDVTALLYTSLIPTQDTESPVIAQLNSTLGRTFSGQDSLTDRVTVWVVPISAAVGLAAAYLSIRSRRLQIASALHAGVSRRSMRQILVIETLAWVLTAVILIEAVAIVVALLISPQDRASLLIIANRPIFAAFLGTIAGAALAWVTTRESHLFHYFKQR